MAVHGSRGGIKGAVARLEVLARAFAGLLACTLLALCPTPLRSAEVFEADCNGNGIADRDEIAADPALDCDGDGVLDTCEPLTPPFLFQAYGEVELPNGVRRFRAADLNEDGRTDIVWAYFDREGIGVALADSGGGFRVIGDLRLRRSGENLVLRDIDGDGFLDIAVLFEDRSRIGFFFGSGGGQFEPVVVQRVDPHLPDDSITRTVVDALRLGDVDGDGAQDLVLSVSSGGEIRVYPGVGRSEVQDFVITGLTRKIADPELVDLNGDSRLDLVARSREYPPNRVYFAAPGGRFVEGPVWEAESRILSYAVLDADGDGLADIAGYSLKEEATVIWYGLGDGRFEPARSVVPGPVRSIRKGDVDGDGREDVILLRDAPEASIELIWFAVERNRTVRQGAALSLESPGLGDFEVGEVDGDGLADLLIGRESGAGIALARGLAPGRFMAPVELPQVLSAGTPATADFNLDGHADFVVVAYTNPPLSEARFYFGDGSGGVTPGPVVPIPGRSTRPETADVVGDERPEVLLPLASPATQALVLTFSEGGDEVQTIPIEFRTEQFHLIGRDLDGDGAKEIVAGFPPGAAIVRVGEDGTFSEPELYRTAALNAVVTADLDRDGIMDIAGVRVTHSPHVLQILRGLPDGRYGARPPGDITRLDGTAQAFVTMDVDLDGDFDFVFGAGDPNEVIVFRNLGDGRFPIAQRIPAGEKSISHFVVADWNLDGAPDLAVFATSPLASQILLLTPGPEGLRVAAALGFGGRFERGLAADIDSDGRPDLVAWRLREVRDRLEPAVFYYRNLAAGLSTDCDLNGVPDTCEAAPDCDADGLPDACEFFDPRTHDRNRNGVPDECEIPCLIPGDCNRDGQLAISDVLCILGHLFRAEPALLPCGDGSAADRGNRDLLDFQGDGSIDLSDAVWLLRFLFLGGPPHHLADPSAPATRCVLFPRCGP